MFGFLRNKQSPNLPSGPQPYVALQASLAEEQNDDGAHFNSYGMHYWNGEAQGVDINDQTIIVNPREFGITGWGDDNQQQFQSGHTNNVVTNESSEQGHGVGPERIWPHYPSPDMPNPFRNLNVFQRSGTDTYSLMVYRPEVTAYWAQALGYELSQASVKNRASGYPTVNQPASVPFVTTIPPVSPGGY